MRPQISKNLLFGKESPRMGELLDLTAYGVIDETPRVGQLGRIFPCTL